MKNSRCYEFKYVIRFSKSTNLEIFSPSYKHGSICINYHYLAVSAYVAKRKASGKTYLFTMRNGKLVTKSSYRKMWERIIRRMQEVCSDQIVDLTAHVFRHNYCTNLCYQIPTVSIKRIAQLLGDTEKMVLDVYNHIILEKEDAAAAVNNAINF